MHAHSWCAFVTAEEDDPALQTEMVEPAMPQDGAQRVDSADGVEWDLCEDLEDEQAVRRSAINYISARSICPFFRQKCDALVNM